TPGDFIISKNMTGYTCKEDVLGEQLENMGTYTVPNYNLVKSVEIIFEGDMVDDVAVIQVGDIVKLKSPTHPVTGEANGEIMTLPITFSAFKIIDSRQTTLVTEKVTIFAGSENVFKTACMLTNGKIKVTFKY
ncbi:hypothetical protein, partial [Campylobacter fetus]|uniref:hypothetical protein n=1 Tax=Campylobacter fetus TaxID=196 RepID=UPI000AF9EC81